MSQTKKFLEIILLNGIKVENFRSPFFGLRKFFKVGITYKRYCDDCQFSSDPYCSQYCPQPDFQRKRWADRYYQEIVNIRQPIDYWLEIYSIIKTSSQRIRLGLAKVTSRDLGGFFECAKEDAPFNFWGNN